MNLALLNVLTLTFTTIISYWRRWFLIFSIFAIISQFFGILSDKVFAEKGLFNVHSTLVITYIIVILLSISKWPELKKSLFFYPFLAIMLLLLHGIIYPWMQNFSTLFYSIKQSKDFAHYIAFLAVFLYLKNNDDLDKGWKVLTFFALYFTFIEVAATISPASIFKCIEYNHSLQKNIFYKVYIPVFPIIIIAFVRSFYRSVAEGKTVNIFITVALGIGVILTIFRAYILSLVFVTPFVMFLSGRYSIFMRSLVPFVLAMVIAISTVGYLGNSNNNNQYDEFITRYENTLNTFVTSGIGDISTYSGGSLLGRDAASIGLNRLIRLRPMLGWGFIDRDSTVGQTIISPLFGFSRQGEFGFVDKGYLDVIAKVGIIGACILYGSLAHILIKLIQLLRVADNVRLQSEAFAGACIILIFLISQLTHANLSQHFGIIPLAVILGLIDRRHRIYMDNINAQNS
jgi:hypothetical protein